MAGAVHRQRTLNIESLKDSSVRHTDARYSLQHAVETNSPENHSINEAIARMNSAAPTDQPACVIKCLSSRRATAVSKTGSLDRLRFDEFMRRQTGRL
jgi:hypothetical protein